MSWLLFMDESGHDHRNTPYEVRGGFAVHASRLWPLIQAVRTLEQSTFGAHLHEYGSEIKGSKLLKKDRFKWEKQGSKFDEATRRQACMATAEGIIQLLKDHDGKVFAAMIPKLKRPDTTPVEFLRKDQVFLLERFFYFLEHKQEMGLIVMDGTQKATDRQFVRRMERYFTLTMAGRERTRWIVPAPLFVESDMAYGVQVADLCIYCLNWGFRLKGMTEPTRSDIKPFVWLLEKAIWHGQGYRAGETFKTHGVVYVPDPYQPR